MMFLRKATIKDAKKLLKWKNDSETRKFAIVTNNKIEWNDHLQWLKKRLERSGFYIIKHGKKDYGDLRFEENEVSIRIDPKARGKGIGGWAISRAQEMFDELTAKIVVGNVASLNLFTGKGFRFKDFVDNNYYILQWKKYRQ